MNLGIFDWPTEGVLDSTPQGGQIKNNDESWQKMAIKLVETGFEPVKAYASRFTVCPL